MLPNQGPVAIEAARDRSRIAVFIVCILFGGSLSFWPGRTNCVLASELSVAQGDQKSKPPANESSSSTSLTTGAIQRRASSIEAIGRFNR